MPHNVLEGILILLVECFSIVSGDLAIGGCQSRDKGVYPFLNV